MYEAHPGFSRAAGGANHRPSTLYAGTFGGGVFSSRDGGATWATMNVGLISLAVNSLALDPQNPGVLYAGTAGGVFVITFGSQ